MPSPSAPGRQPRATGTSPLGFVTASGRTRTAGFLTAGGGLMIAISAFLPWATVIGFISAGLSGAEVLFVFALGVVVGVMGIRVLQDDDAIWVHAVLWLAAVLAVITAVVAIQQINSSDNMDLVGMGTGLYVFIAGGAAAIFGTASLQTTASRRRVRSRTILLSEDRRYWWDSKGWRSLAAALPPDVQRSADGTYWWTGQVWEPMPKGILSGVARAEPLPTAATRMVAEARAHNGQPPRPVIAPPPPPPPPPMS